MPLEVGSATHGLLAVKYSKMIDSTYPITPEVTRDFLLDVGCDGVAVMEAWRLYEHYEVQYEDDYLTPLAVEYHAVDPKTRESCRYDLIARVERAHPGVLAGTYAVETKTASRFDDATLDGWRNDGEVIGQTMIWKRLNLDEKFGPLVGVMVKVLGKQKVPQFHRTIVPPQGWQIKQHGQDLRMWHALRRLAVATGIFPRARTNCIGRYGKCSQWEHCADGVDGPG